MSPWLRTALIALVTVRVEIREQDLAQPDETTPKASDVRRGEIGLGAGRTFRLVRRGSAAGHAARPFGEPVALRHGSVTSSARSRVAVFKSGQRCPEQHLRSGE
jgi:hypothetical protein